MIRPPNPLSFCFARHSSGPSSRPKVQVMRGICVSGTLSLPCEDHASISLSACAERITPNTIFLFASLPLQACQRRVSAGKRRGKPPNFSDTEARATTLLLLVGCGCRGSVGFSTPPRTPSPYLPRLLLGPPPRRDLFFPHAPSPSTAHCFVVSLSYFSLNTIFSPAGPARSPFEFSCGPSPVGPTPPVAFRCSSEIRRP